MAEVVVVSCPASEAVVGVGLAVGLEMEGTAGADGDAHSVIQN